MLSYELDVEKLIERCVEVIDAVPLDCVDGHDGCVGQEGALARQRLLEAQHRGKTQRDQLVRPGPLRVA